MSKSKELNQLAEQIAALSKKMDSLVKSEYGDDAFIFVSDDETISVCSGYKRNGSVDAKITFDCTHYFHIGSW